MIDMLDKEDDEIDLVFQAMYKRIKKNLTDEEQEDLMEELSSTITRHVKKERAKRSGCPNVAINCPLPTTTPTSATTPMNHPTINMNM